MKLLELIAQNKKYLLYKYAPTSLMLMLSAYIYSLLRGVKDSILVPRLGAELISFVKFYGVFPSTIIFFICFSKLANILSREKLYISIVSFFISFFLIYAFILEPYQPIFHPDLSQFAIKYTKLKYQIMLVENWTITLFYIMSELCGTVMLTLLFWQFANDLYTVSEAKKTYALFGLIGQSGLVIAGLVQNHISEHFINSMMDEKVWETSLKWMMISIAIAGIGAMAIYLWMYKNVLTNPELCQRQHNAVTEKVSLSVKDSFKYVFSSKYLWLIMVIVFCYGVGVNMIESVWKDQIRQQYSTQNAYSSFIGKFHIFFGCSTIAVMLLGNYILRTFRWLVPALCTPIGAGSTGVIFFSVIIFKDFFKPLLDNYNLTLVSLAVILGSIQVIIFKSFNYAFVDATKEMAFIPLDRELRTKGKAAVDVIGGRFGKSFGAILQQLMFHFISPSLSNLTVELCIAFVITMTMWIFSVIALNKEFIKVADLAVKK